MSRRPAVPGDWSPREAWLRRQSCCASTPPCRLCPLRDENKDKGLKELMEEGLREEMGAG